MTETKPAYTQLIEALIAAQQKFKPAVRDATNPFYKSKYVDLEGVYAACQEALWKNGLTVVQTTHCVGDGTTLLITQLWHTSGEHLEGEYPLNPSKPNDPQMLGAAMTYARRYALMAILGIAAEDDDGETAAGRGAARPNMEAPKESNIAVAWPGNCPDHKRPFRQGSKGGWFCAAQVGAGWCQKKPKPQANAEPTLPEGMQDESPDESLPF